MCTQASTPLHRIVICNRCNQAKADLPADLYLKLLDAVRKVYGEGVLEQVLCYLSMPGEAKKVGAWSLAKTCLKNFSCLQFLDTRACLDCFDPHGAGLHSCLHY